MIGLFDALRTRTNSPNRRIFQISSKLKWQNKASVIEQKSLELDGRIPGFFFLMAQKSALQ
jgi:hypothetical protein